MVALRDTGDDSLAEELCRKCGKSLYIVCTNTRQTCKCFLCTETTLSATDTVEPDCPSSIAIMPKQQGTVLIYPIPFMQIRDYYNHAQLVTVTASQHFHNTWIQVVIHWVLMYIIYITAKTKLLRQQSIWLLQLRRSMNAGLEKGADN